MTGPETLVYTWCIFASLQNRVQCFLSHGSFLQGAQARLRDPYTQSLQCPLQLPGAKPGLQVGKSVAGIVGEVAECPFELTDSLEPSGFREQGMLEPERRFWKSMTVLRENLGQT